MNRLLKIISLLAITPLALASSSHYAIKTFEPAQDVIIEKIETSNIPETIIITPVESTVIVTPSPTATPAPTAEPTTAQTVQVTPTPTETTAAPTDPTAATTKATAATTKATTAATTKAPAATTAATTDAPPVETSPPVATTAAYTPNCDNIKNLIVSNLQSRGYWFPDAASIGGGSAALTTNYYYSDDMFAQGFLLKFTKLEEIGTMGVISVSVWIENGYVNFSYDKCAYPTT